MEIRIIKKNGTDQVVGDRLLELDGVKINPIDKPAFVVYREANPSKLVFSYPRSSEDIGRFTSANGHFTIEYGKVSGRIKVVILQRGNMTATDQYEIIEALKSHGSGLRFRDNVSSQMKMVGKLLPKLEIR